MLSDTKRDFRLKGSATAFYINNSVTAPNLVMVLLFYSDLHASTFVYAIVFYCFCGCIDIEIPTEIAGAHFDCKNLQH